MTEPWIEPTQLLTGAQKEVIETKMRKYMMDTVNYKGASTPLILQTSAKTVVQMVGGAAGRWLRRYLARERVVTKAKDVLWGWAGQQSIAGWLHLEGGRPQTGAGGPLEEWRVQAVEMGGWRSMLRQGDTAWMSSFRLKVL